jgi:hypothetical protein
VESYHSRDPKTLNRKDFVHRKISQWRDGNPLSLMHLKIPHFLYDSYHYNLFKTLRCIHCKILIQRVPEAGGEKPYNCKAG